VVVLTTEVLQNPTINRNQVDQELTILLQEADQEAAVVTVIEVVLDQEAPVHLQEVVHANKK